MIKSTGDSIQTILILIFLTTTRLTIVDVMSDSHTIETPAEPLFSVTEIQQFSDDDTTAGTAIGKMLAGLFLYTVFAMTLVIWWTHEAVETDHGARSENEVATEPASGH